METRNPTRICMVRHGETDWNVEKRIQGHIDISLNAAGIAQAAATAVGLSAHSFDAAYSSDLDRAWQTAQAIGQRQEIEIRKAPGLRERHYGVLQGLTTAEIAVHYPTAYKYYLARDTEYDFKSGESLNDFSRRIVTAVEALAAAHPGETLLLVSHGGVLDICYRRATGRCLTSARDFPIPNAALNWFEVGDEGWCLLTWADRTHLAQSLEESPE